MSPATRGLESGDLYTRHWMLVDAALGPGGAGRGVAGCGSLFLASYIMLRYLGESSSPVDVFSD